MPPGGGSQHSFNVVACFEAEDQTVPSIKLERFVDALFVAGAFPGKDKKNLTSSGMSGFSGGGITSTWFLFKKSSDAAD